MISRISALLRKQVPDIEAEGLLFASGPTVPTDATAGYQTGAIFQHVDGGANDALYVNEGTFASCAFKVAGTLTGDEQTYLSGVTAGTVAASKAVVVDAEKDISTFRDVGARDISGRNIDAGASGTAGTVDVFPATAIKGKLAITKADNAGDTTTTLTAAEQAAARTYTIPDAGAAASFVMSEGAQTVNGVKTLGSPPVMSGASITANTTPAASLENGTGLSVLGVAGDSAAANADIVGTDGQVLRVAGSALGFGDINGANITADTIPSAALVNGAGIAAMVAAGLGTSVSYIKSDNGTKTLLTANAEKDRGCLVVVTVTEAFDTGDTKQLILKLGETDTIEKCAAASVFTDAALGKVFVFGFLNTSTKAILATLENADGTGTGAASITVLALPES